MIFCNLEKRFFIGLVGRKTSYRMGSKERERIIKIDSSFMGVFHERAWKTGAVTRRNVGLCDDFVLKGSY